MRRVFSCSEASVLTSVLVLIVTGGAVAQEFAGREKLRAHSAEFRREVIKVTDGVWVAVLAVLMVTMLVVTGLALWRTTRFS